MHERVLWNVPENGQREGRVIGHTEDGCLVAFRGLGIFTVAAYELERPRMALSLSGTYVEAKDYPEAYILAPGDSLIVSGGILRRVV